MGPIAFIRPNGSPAFQSMCSQEAGTPRLYRDYHLSNHCGSLRLEHLLGRGKQDVTNGNLHLAPISMYVPDTGKGMGSPIAIRYYRLFDFSVSTS